MAQSWVSVVIPTCGRDISLVSRAVESVLSQTYQNTEAVVVDDNLLTSPFSAGIEAYCAQNDRIRYLRTLGKGGACAARNLGAANARGEYVGFLDDDDTWLPQKAEVSLRLFENDVAMVGTRGWQITLDEKGAEVNRELYMGDLFTSEPTFQGMLRCDSIGTTTLALVHKLRFAECGGFRTDLPARQDYDCWLRMLKKYRIVLSQECLFEHFIHTSEQISRSDARALEGLIKVYQEFKPDFDGDKRAYAYIHMLMLKRYRGLGKPLQEMLCLARVLRVQPRYLGRYVADTTRNERLRDFLRRRQRNEASESGEKTHA